MCLCLCFSSAGAGEVSLAGGFETSTEERCLERRDSLCGVDAVAAVVAVVRGRPGLVALGISFALDAGMGLVERWAGLREGLGLMERWVGLRDSRWGFLVRVHVCFTLGIRRMYCCCCCCCANIGGGFVAPDVSPLCPSDAAAGGDASWPAVWWHTPSL